MKTIENLVQGSPEWLLWRKNHIGASEVPIILGESDFMTVDELWELKTGRREPFKGNWATERGHRAEPLIRKLYEEMYGVKVTSPVGVYDDFPTLSASFDGYNKELGIIAEFKYPSQRKHAEALCGNVPKTYVSQVQAQLLVSGFDTCHYVSFDGDRIEVVVVKADKDKQAQILSKCKEFWRYVEEDERPEGATAYPTGDTLEILSNRFIMLNRLIHEHETEMALIKSRIMELVPDAKASFYGIDFQRVMRAGSIDYKKIPELAGVDLEKYRKKPTEVVTIKVIEE